MNTPSVFNTTLKNIVTKVIVPSVVYCIILYWLNLCIVLNYIVFDCVSLNSGHSF